MDQATGVRLNKPHKSADPRQGTQIRDRRSAAIAARKRALSEWDKANPGTAYDPELFRREILPWLGTAPLSEIMEAAACFGVEGAWRVGWHQPLQTPLSTNGASSHSPPDQPLFRPPLPQGDR